MSRNWKTIITHQDTKIINGINILNQTGLLIIIVVDFSNKLIGTVTDGDIRVGLANKLTLEDPLKLIMNNKPKYILENTSLMEIKEMQTHDRYIAFPIVTSKKIVIGCHFLDNKVSEIEKIPFLIMAGGFGTRLGKLTKNCPKPMLKINKIPILEHIIMKANFEGFKNIYISTHYKSEVIQNYFSKKKYLDLNITCFKEEIPLGTGGGFRFMNKFNGPIVVTNGDIISKIGYHKLLNFHRNNDGFATMAIIKHKIENPFGVVEYDGINLTKFQEKPSWTTYINAGIYVLDNQATKFIKKDQYISMPQLFNKIKKNNKNVLIFHMHEDWVDIGTPDQFKKTKKSLKSVN